MGQINTKTKKSNENNINTNEIKNQSIKNNQSGINITPRRKRSTPRGGQYLKRMLQDQEKRRKSQERKRELMSKCGGCFTCFII